jgi:hypothetical protein
LLGPLEHLIGKRDRNLPTHKYAPPPRRSLRQASYSTRNPALPGRGTSKASRATNRHAHMDAGIG